MLHTRYGSVTVLETAVSQVLAATAMTAAVLAMVGLSNSG